VRPDALEVPLRFPRIWVGRIVAGLVATGLAIGMVVADVAGHVEGQPLDDGRLLLLGMVALTAVVCWASAPLLWFYGADPRWRIRVSAEGVVVQRGLPPGLVPHALAWGDCEAVFMKDVETPRGPDMVVMAFKRHGSDEPLVWILSRRHGSDMLPVRDWILEHRPDVGMTNSLRSARAVPPQSSSPRAE
jgi:hypothetical protein